MTPLLKKANFGFDLEQFQFNMSSYTVCLIRIINRFGGALYFHLFYIQDILFPFLITQTG